MRIITATFMMTFLTLTSPAAFACHVVRPIPGEIDKFSAIFVGEVTGIRLRSYENLQLGKYDGCTIPEAGEQSICFNIASDPKETVFALPRQVIRGEIKDVIELDQNGCNRESISMKDRAIFFVNSGGTSAMIVWEDEPDFNTWLKRLGVSLADR
jgi:hypothetical protein